jgi:dihydrofolate reductase
MTVSVIVAMAVNRVIGRDNAIPWKLSPDLRRFKALTMGHTLIMGRRTYESIGRPLPGRRTIVITNRGLPAATGSPEAGSEVGVASSLDEALGLAKSAGENHAFIAGGAQVYAAAMPHADRLYLTLIETAVNGDTTFPEYDVAAWRLAYQERHPPALDAPFSYTFFVYTRKVGRPTLG